MKVEGIQCDNCKKLYPLDFKEIFHFNGNVNRNSEVVIETGDYCRDCVRIKFGLFQAEIFPSRPSDVPFGLRTEIRFADDMCVTTNDIISRSL